MTQEVPQVSGALAEGIALLIDLAEKGEINPWDVQVIEVIDRYLSKLAPEDNSNEEDDFKSLSQSGQAFLYASILVWLKAESLAESEDAEEELPPEEELLDGEDSPDSPRLPLKLEQQLRRRAVAPKPRKRPVTLQELIEQLQLIGATIEKRGANPRPRGGRKMSRSKAAKEIAELAHQENLVETAGELEQFLKIKWGELALDWLDFDSLLQLWPPASLPHGRNNKPSSDRPAEEMPLVEPHLDRVGVFWALLLLSSQSKVELAQEEFYQDIKVRTIQPAEQSSMQQA
jgi:segregation and condensation protein A